MSTFTIWLQTTYKDASINLISLEQNGSAIRTNFNHPKMSCISTSRYPACWYGYLEYLPLMPCVLPDKFFHFFFQTYRGIIQTPMFPPTISITIFCIFISDIFLRKKNSWSPSLLPLTFSPFPKSPLSWICFMPSFPCVFLENIALLLILLKYYIYPYNV